MSAPRVFVSSTYYDLKHIRNYLETFIQQFGYTPVLSERGDVFYASDSDAQQSCLEEVRSCQLFVLVIGAKRGSEYQDTGETIVNHEYRAAIDSGIPVYTLIDADVLCDYSLYRRNRDNKEVKLDAIQYTAAEDTRIFDFIFEVTTARKDNAYQPFRSVSDIESYLKKQWASKLLALLKKEASMQGEPLASYLARTERAFKRNEELLLQLVDMQDKGKRDEVLQRADRIADGESFVHEVKQAFALEKPDKAVLSDFEDAPLTENWYDYLLGTKAFYIQELWPMNDRTDAIFAYGGSKGYYLRSDRFGDFARRGLEKAYDRFKQLTDDERKKAVRLFFAE